MFNLTYEFKLKPNKNQISLFEEWLETHRRVYNYALAERKDWYKSRSCQKTACDLRSCYSIPADAPRPTFASQCKSLTAARKSNEFLGKVNAGGFAAGLLMTIPLWRRRGGPAFWRRTEYQPPHPEAQYRMVRTTVPQVRRKR